MACLFGIVVARVIAFVLRLCGFCCCAFVIAVVDVVVVVVLLLLVEVVVVSVLVIVVIIALLVVFVAVLLSLLVGVSSCLFSSVHLFAPPCALALHGMVDVVL